MISIKARAGFLRALFSRRFKRGRNGKLAKQCSSTHSNDDAASVRSAVNPRTMVGVDKELEILGLLTDPRIPPAPMPQHQSQNVVYQSVPHPSGPATIPLPGRTADSYPKPRLQLETQAYDTLPSKQYDPLTPTSPLLPPPPALWLPLHRPLPARPKSERGTGPTRVEEEPEIYTDTITPLSPSPSYLTFATQSSGVFPCGFEPYVVDDATGPVPDWKSEDTVLVLPSPPRADMAYGYARR
ncbi:hypothetical protein BJX63DRAFT_437794 [Aspergillus granulosus]|uniref:Uncharacterized protein n=1 Tax=Aspergillus granulosus TaxID=176169 RepID=A0ABR4GTV7_9EURO